MTIPGPFSYKPYKRPVRSNGTENRVKPSDLPPNDLDQKLLAIGGSRSKRRHIQLGMTVLAARGPCWVWAFYG